MHKVDINGLITELIKKKWAKLESIRSTSRTRQDKGWAWFYIHYSNN